MAQIIALNGGKLTIDDVWAVAHNKAKISIDDVCKHAVDDSRHFVENVGQHVLTYGVNTGFGPMAQYVMSQENVEQLQYNLIRSHAVGMGHVLSEEYCIAVMVVRLNTLIQGKSGVTWELVQLLKTFINKRIVPVIPEHGSVGASGDLVQLAHVALGLIGEGRVYYQGVIQPTSKVLATTGLTPHKLTSKEGLALINGTSAMAGIGALVCYKAQKQFEYAIQTGSFAYELFNGFDDPISQELQDLRPHSGQQYVAKRMRELVKDSQLTQTRSDLAKHVAVDEDSVRKITDKVQDIYSIRCMPQIYGPVYETLQHAIEVITTEINSVTDNPVTNSSNDTLIHGGNFHGDYVSLEMDKLKIVMTRVAQTMERHVNLFLNPNLRDNMPPFLNLQQPGLDLALQGLQFVATSTTAEMQSLCFPNYIHTIPTNGDNQDIVSMGTNSALLADKVVCGLYHVLAVNYIALTQAVDVQEAEALLSSNAHEQYTQIREVFPAIKQDRDLTDDLENLATFLSQ